MDKLVFITGASSGIGEACARIFAKNGYRLILNARSEGKLTALKDELVSEYNSDVLLLPFNVSDRETAESVIADLPAEYRNIDILVNNAGLALGTDKEHEGSLDEYFQMIDTNIKGLLTCTRCIVPGMVERQSGHIINIGSIAGDGADRKSTRLNSSH